MKPIFKKVVQVSIVVKDLKKALKMYYDEYGMGPWNIYNFNPSKIRDMIRNDKRVDHKFHIAQCFLGDIEMELIEPLDEKSIYAEFLKEHGEGIHHVAYEVEDYDEAMKFFRNKGLIVTQQGNRSFTGDLIYTYISTEQDLKHSVEICKIMPNYIKYKKDKYGNKRITFPVPDEVYPPED